MSLTFSLLLSVLSTLQIEFLAKVQSHSWAACTKYQTEITGQDYDDSECVGYTRNWANEYGPRSGSFGADIGADYQPGGSSATGTWCDQTLGASDDYSDTYDNTYPMASYTVGETVRIIWPAKNHASYECKGNIPDTGMKLFYNTNVNPTNDPQTLSDWTLVYDWHSEGTPGTDGVPFQNCPKFCENTDRAVCYGDVTLPDTLFTQGSGVYTFMWYWAFNHANDIYTSCFEAYVDTSGTVINPSPTTRPTNNPVTPSPTVVGATLSPSISPTESPTSSNSNNNNNNNNNNNEESQYIVFVPICITGVSYNEELILEGASSIFGNVNWEIFLVTEGEFKFNVTLKTHTNDASIIQDIATSATTNNGDNLFCSTYTSLWISEGQGIILGCNSCKDVLVYLSDSYEPEDEPSSSSDNNNENNNNNTDNTITIVVICIIVTIILLLIISCIVFYKFYYLKYNRKSNHFNNAGSSTSKNLAIHTTTNTNTNTNTAGQTRNIQPNIVYAGDDEDNNGDLNI